MSRLPIHAVLSFFLVLLLAPPGPARAAGPEEEQEIIDKARYTAERMLADPDFRTMTQLLKKARAVVVIPTLLKGGFFLGAEGGTGVLLARTGDGGWSYPAFYTMAG